MPDKYQLYEIAVQSAELHATWFDQVYGELRGKKPGLLREDFCGTFQISRKWVQLRKTNFALALDLDAEVLKAGIGFLKKELNPGDQRRILPIKKDVCQVTSPKADVVVACNYSFFIFKQRQDLLKYFRSVRKSLASQGLFFLELAGGPGMIEKVRESKKLKTATYYWDQKSFDPIERNGHYAIHFRLNNGKWLKNAFEYDWRLWTIPEIRDVLRDAGFKKTRVYWETEHKGVGTGEYLEAQKGDNAWSYIAYVVAEG